MGLDQGLYQIRRVSDEEMKKLTGMTPEERVKYIGSSDDIHSIAAEYVDCADGGINPEYRDIKQYMAKITLASVKFDGDRLCRDRGMEGADWGFAYIGSKGAGIRAVLNGKEEKLELSREEQGRYEVPIEEESYIFIGERLLYWRKEYDLDSFISECIYSDRLDAWKREHPEQIPTAEEIQSMSMHNCEYARLSRKNADEIRKYLEANLRKFSDDADAEQSDDAEDEEGGDRRIYTQDASYNFCDDFSAFGKDDIFYWNWY